MEPTQHPYKLQEGERLLWHGGKREELWWRFPAALFWMVYGLDRIFNRDNPMPVRVLFFILVLLYAVLFVWALWPTGRIATWRKQWMYRVTNRSVVVQGPGRGIFSIVNTAPLGDISDLYVSDRQNGLGTLVIGYAKEPKTLSDGTKALSKLTYMRLVSITNPHEAYALIDSARKSAV
jgi:hypothetical protein